MGFINRVYLDKSEYQKFQPGTKKFKDKQIDVFFFELNQQFPGSLEKKRHFYGWDGSPFKLRPMSQKYGDYQKLARLTKDGVRFNAHAMVNLVNDAQKNGELGQMYGGDLRKWPEAVLKECAKANCEEFAQALDQFLKTGPECPEKGLAAELVNAEYDIVENQYRIPSWTDAILKIKWEK